MATFLIDFDGTCVPALPPGGTLPDAIDTGAAQILRSLHERGHTLVLWTARNDSPDNPYNWISGVQRPEGSLSEAIRWFSENKIPLSGINEVPGEIEKIGPSRKALGDYLIDDTSIGIPLIRKEVPWRSPDGALEKIQTFYVDWEKIKDILKENKLL